LKDRLNFPLDTFCLICQAKTSYFKNDMDTETHHNPDILTSSFVRIIKEKIGHGVINIDSNNPVHTTLKKQTGICRVTQCVLLSQ
jgi:hypothetical protein